jgi:hypothetical protein
MTDWLLSYRIGPTWNARVAIPSSVYGGAKPPLSKAEGNLGPERANSHSHDEILRFAQNDGTSWLCPKFQSDPVPTTAPQ